MRRGPLAAAVGAAMLATGAAAATPVDGLWALPGSAIEVRIGPCGPAVCGTLINSNRIKADPGARDDKNKNAALRGRLLRGIVMIEGMRGGPQTWTGGRVYSPGSGDTYAATMQLSDPETLKVKVCIAGPICPVQVLKRAH